MTRQTNLIRKLAAVLIAAVSLFGIASAVPTESAPEDVAKIAVAVGIGATVVAASHSNPCNVSSPIMVETFGCSKQRKYGSANGYVQLDDTHTNGNGLYAYAVYTGHSTQPSRWDSVAAWGGSWARTFWFSGIRAIEFIAYCDGKRLSNGSNCRLYFWV